MRAASISLLLMSIALAGPVAAQSSLVKDEHVSVELVGERSSLKPGARAWLGIKLSHQPHWHTYWINSGDSGLPTRIDWQLPSGFRADDILWPAPRRFSAGGLNNFGYDDTVLLPVAIDVPADARVSAPVVATVRWVVCSDDLCIPGKAALRLTLPIATTDASDSKHAALFSETRERLPASMDWQGRAVASADKVRIELSGTTIPNASGLDVFPTAPNLLSNAPPKISRVGDRLIVESAQSDYFASAPKSIGLVFTQAAKSWSVAVPWTPAVAGSGSAK